MFPYLFFSNGTLPRQLYFIINENSRLSGDPGMMGIVILQVFFLLYTSLRSVYSVMKRDNIQETAILMLLPGGGLFIIGLMETILTSGFLGNPDFSAESSKWLLSSSFFSLQILILAAVFAGASLFYEWMNWRLNGKWTHPLLLLCFYGFETVVTAASIFIGAQGLSGGGEWVDTASPMVLNWYVYGLNLLFTKSVVYLFAIAMGLLFANRSARARLWGRMRIAEKIEGADRGGKVQEKVGLQTGEGFQPAEGLKAAGGQQEPSHKRHGVRRNLHSTLGEFRDFEETWAEDISTGDAQHSITRYIQSKSMPYFLGLGAFGFGLPSLLVALQYSRYVEGTFYQKGDMTFAIVFSLFIVAFICVMGWYQHFLSVLWPCRCRSYKRLIRSRQKGEAVIMFYQEFFVNKPLFSFGRLVNVILTPNFLVFQSNWPQIVPIWHIAGIQMKPLASGAMVRNMVLRMKDGERVRIQVPSGAAQYISTILLEKMDPPKGAKRYRAYKKRKASVQREGHGE